jgi:hypothetical protein
MPFRFFSPCQSQAASTILRLLTADLLQVSATASIGPSFTEFQDTLEDFHRDTGMMEYWNTGLMGRAVEDYSDPLFQHSTIPLLLLYTW